MKKKVYCSDCKLTGCWGKKAVVWLDDCRFYKEKNFFQKITNTPIGYFTRGQIILLTLSILSCLAIGWLVVVGLWAVMG